MNIKGIKLLLASAFGMSLMGLSQISSADWEAGACPQPHNGPAPCIERSTGSPAVIEHFNGSGDHADEFHGPIEFSGMTELSCSFITVDCELSLVGNVKKFQDDNGDWRVGVQVESGSVEPGDFLCTSIELSNYPWYIGDEDMHEGFGSDTGVAYAPNVMPLVGNLGDIDLDASFFSADEAHVHNVEFDNNGSNPSYFNFSSALFEDGDADNDSGCSVDGLLEVQAPYNDINIY